MLKQRLSVAALCMSAIIANAGEPSGIRSDRKIIEISKIVKLSAAQEVEIRKAYDAYNATLDSALYEVKDPVVASRMKHSANRRFNSTLMNTLTEKQRNRYIRITSVPDVEAKTEYKISLLRESGEYTESELEAKKNEIFNYLMAEKTVYVRDKYDLRKQKDNIRRLKEVQPKSLKESDIREKQKAQGRVVNGKVKW